MLYTAGRGDRTALVPSDGGGWDALDVCRQRRAGGPASGRDLVGDRPNHRFRDRVRIAARRSARDEVGLDRNASIARRIWWSGSMLRRAAAIWRRTSAGSGSSSPCASSLVGRAPWVGGACGSRAWRRDDGLAVGRDGWRRLGGPAPAAASRSARSAGSGLLGRAAAERAGAPRSWVAADLVLSE